MTKAELVGVMAKEAGITKAAAAMALDAYVARSHERTQEEW